MYSYIWDSLYQNSNSKLPIFTAYFVYNVLYFMLFRYRVRDEFKADVQLIFSNCKRYNEDESPVGRAGHLMKLFFDSRWAELTTV